MMLRVKDSDRLPGGLAFSVVQKEAGTYLRMKVSTLKHVLSIRQLNLGIEQSYTSIGHFSPVLGAVDQL